MLQYQFDTPAAAAAALAAVLGHARESEDNYVFGGLNVRQLMAAGLWIQGDEDGVREVLDKIPGAVRQEALSR
jgi:hypothetical protein